MTPEEIEELSNGADLPYWAALDQGQLVLPRCGKCEKWLWPAVWRCGDCGSWEILWTEVPLSGTIYSWTRTWHRFQGTEELDLPYVSVVVALDDANGVRLMGILEKDEREPKIGQPVQGTVTQSRFEERFIPSIRWRNKMPPSEN